MTTVENTVSKFGRIVLCGVVSGVVAGAFAQAPAAGSFTNPVLKEDWPDPAFWRGTNGTFLSVATGLRTIFASSNLVDWVDTGRNPLTPDAAAKLKAISRHWWAPCVKRLDGRWVLYVSHLNSDIDCSVSALVSDADTGPFSFVRTIVDGKALGIENTIDPFVVETEGRVWMFFGSDQDGIHRVELTRDGLRFKPGAKVVHVAGLRKKVPGKSQWGDQGCWEGTYLHPHGGWWYLFCSGGRYDIGDYHLTVGRAERIDGVFRDRAGNPMTRGLAKPILSSEKGDRFIGPGHNGEVFTSTDGREWMFFHAHDTTREKASDRPTLLQELRWTPDGWPYFDGGKPKVTEERFEVRGLAEGSQPGDADPAALSFRKMASRRHILDNELALASYEPNCVIADVQNPSPDFDGNLVQVAGWCPCAHYGVEVSSGAARIAFANPDGSSRVSFVAAPGHAIDAQGASIRLVGQTVPPPPFRLSVLAAGNTFNLLISKAGKTVYHGSAKNETGVDLREKARSGAVKFFVDAHTGSVVRATSSLSAGFGQADTRFVTTGRDKRLYLENGRVFFTFSARGVGAMGVASFDPSRFDVRLEGSILIDAGDGLLRGDGPADLFYDDVEDEWRAWVCNFSTVQSKDGSLSGRARGGVNYAWSKRAPLHGLSVMEERNMGLPGMNEDPTGFYDPTAGKWRVFLSEFTADGIRGSLWESEFWNGPYARLTHPTKEDSTGQCLVDIGGIRWALAGSADRACHVYTYPDLRLHGDIRFDVPPWNANCPNGRVWASLGVLPRGFPHRYVFLTMDRANFPGVPMPNWTYGALHYYVADD